MPNWYDNNVYIKFSSPEKAKSFYEELSAATRKDPSLMSLNRYAGKDSFCRGNIFGNNLNDCEVSIRFESAWYPDFDPIILFVDKFAKENPEITYASWSPIEEKFLSNDLSRWSWFIRLWDEKEHLPPAFRSFPEKSFFISNKELRPILLKALSCSKSRSIKSMVRSSNLRFGFGITMDQVEYTDISEFVES